MVFPVAPTPTEKFLQHYLIENMSKISIDIKQSDAVGWIHLTFTTDHTNITVHFSDVFNPALEVIFVFWALMKDSLPGEINIDEEGEIKVIRILPGDNDLVRLQVADYDYGKPDDEDPEYPRTYIDIEIAKDTLMQEFFPKFISFLENDFRPERWRDVNLKIYLLPTVKDGYFAYLQERAALS